MRTRLDPKVWSIETDPTELEAAILNLAVNARDAMPAGGELVIETANVELDSHYAAANIDVTAGPYVVIAVADTGMGMTSDVLNKVFEPFFTTKPDGQGTGLGLSQVYGFVRQAGGHVKLYSEPSMGTTAKIYFPKASKFSESDHRADEPTQLGHALPARWHETILVVEDDDDVRNYTVSSLRELGYAVLEAGDAASALEIVERQAEIQLLFTDLGLPGPMDGKGLAERIHAIRPTIKILITTAYAGAALIHDGRLDEGVQLLSKPFSFVGLANRIRELLDGPDPEDARILVVDDEVLLRTLLVDVLGAAGLQAEEAGTFHEARAKIHSAGDNLAAAIIDLGLPDRRGDQLIAEIRRLRPRLPIILATGFADENIRREFSGDPLLRIMTKPFKPELLLATLSGLGVRTTGRS